MRTLTPALLDAQRTPASRPYVRLAVRAWAGSAPRLHWQRLYNGAETDAENALAVAPDGSLVRYAISGTDLLTRTVPSPGPGAAFGSWSTARAGSRLCAVAASASE